jgi:hypothetical protein
MKAIATKHSWRRGRNNHVQAIAVRKAAAEAQRRLGIPLQQYRDPIPVSED